MHCVLSVISISRLDDSKLLCRFFEIVVYSCRVVVFVSSTYGSSGTVGIVCYAHSALNLVRAHLVNPIFLCRSDDVIYLDGGNKDLSLKAINDVPLMCYVAIIFS